MVQSNDDRPGIILVISSIFSVLWLPAVFVFKAHSEHLGWGFGATIIWLYSLWLITVVFLIGTIVEMVRFGVRRRLHLACWFSVTAVYLLLILVLRTIPAFGRWLLS